MKTWHYILLGIIAAVLGYLFYDYLKKPKGNTDTANAGNGGSGNNGGGGGGLNMGQFSPANLIGRTYDEAVSVGRSNGYTVIKKGAFAPYGYTPGKLIMVTLGGYGVAFVPKVVNVEVL